MKEHPILFRGEMVRAFRRPVRKSAVASESSAGYTDPDTMSTQSLLAYIDSLDAHLCDTVNARLVAHDTLVRRMGATTPSTGVPEQPTVTPEAEEAAPESFWQGLKACEEGRTVDMEKALSEAPPGEPSELAWKIAKELEPPKELCRPGLFPDVHKAAEMVQRLLNEQQKEVMPNDGTISDGVTPGGCASGEQTQLLPCPFCGREASGPEQKAHCAWCCGEVLPALQKLWYVECSRDCGAWGAGPTPQKAIERWNRRAPAPEPSTDFMTEPPPHKPDQAFDLDAELKKLLTRWIPRTERMPTREDANSLGQILWWNKRSPELLALFHFSCDPVFGTDWTTAPEPPEPVKKAQTWEKAMEEDLLKDSPTIEG